MQEKPDYPQGRIQDLKLGVMQIWMGQLEKNYI